MYIYIYIITQFNIITQIIANIIAIIVGIDFKHPWA